MWFMMFSVILLCANVSTCQRCQCANYEKYFLQICIWWLVVALIGKTLLEHIEADHYSHSMSSREPSSLGDEIMLTSSLLLMFVLLAFLLSKTLNNLSMPSLHYTS